MITEQQYQDAIERRDENFKIQGMTQENWDAYKSALDTMIRYREQLQGKK